MQQFAVWCIYFDWWWWSWDISWIANTYLGAKQLNSPGVLAWSEPLFEAFVCGCWCLYWTDSTLYWVSKPIMHRDPTTAVRQLHNDKYAALESDIENLYFWHGILVPAFVVVRPEWIKLKHIDDESNAEVRRVMIERYKHGEEVHGPAAYMRDAGAKRLDHDERFGTLWRREVDGDEPIVMLEVVNSTREADGRFKRYWLRAPPQMQTAHEAVAWTFDRAATEYAPLIET